MVEDLCALTLAEDRLSHLMEREALYPPLGSDERLDERKVPGCLSGLWLKGDLRDGRCYFSCHSDSDLVHGVVSFVCDLYSNRTPEEIASIGGSLIDLLRLDGLLSTTRKRALLVTTTFILRAANKSGSTTTDRMQTPAVLESALA